MVDGPALLGAVEPPRRHARPDRSNREGGVMGQFFAVLFLFYMLISMVFLPLIAWDSYLKNRDCRVKHNVDVCVILYVPDVTP
jgi:hypothetical protein